MRRWLIGMVVLAGCNGGGDQQQQVDAGGADAAPGADGAPPIDAAPSADARPECNASSGFLRRAVAGGASDTQLLDITMNNDPGVSDGHQGPILEGGNNLRLEDIAYFNPSMGFAAGGGAIYRIAHPAVGVNSATRLGDAPGITALAVNSTELFGATGMTISRITPSPFAVTTVGTITPPAGCTSITDFLAPLSGGDYVFQLALDCATSTKVVQWSWTPPSGPFRDTGIVSQPGPAGVVGVSLGFVVTSDNKLYRFNSLAGAFTFVRNLSACLGLSNGALRGLQE